MNGLGAAIRRRRREPDGFRHRRRRAGGLGQGHAGARGLPSFSACPSRYRPALPGGGVLVLRRRRRSGRSGVAAAEAAGQLDPRRPRRPALARGRGRRRPHRWSPRSRRCGPRCWTCSGVSRPSRHRRRGGARRARHRHASSAPSRRQVVRHRQRRGARAERRLEELRRRRRRGYIRARPADICRNATRATRASGGSAIAAPDA